MAKRRDIAWLSNPTARSWWRYQSPHGAQDEHHLDAYLARTAAIRTKLERLQQLGDDHFGHDPDAINWGHVGDLGRMETGLGELLAIFGSDGE